MRVRRQSRQSFSNGGIIKSGKVKIEGIERRRTGSATVSLGGETHHVDFHLPQEMELRVTPVEENKSK
jgi:hypothetical protein